MLVAAASHSVHCRLKGIPSREDSHASQVCSNGRVFQFHRAMHGDSCYLAVVLWKKKRLLNDKRGNIMIRKVMTNELSFLRELSFMEIVKDNNKDKIIKVFFFVILPILFWIFNLNRRKSRYIGFASLIQNSPNQFQGFPFQIQNFSF